MGYAIVALAIVSIGAVVAGFSLALRRADEATAAKLDAAAARAETSAARAQADAQRLRADGAEATRAADAVRLERVVAELRSTLATQEATLARSVDPAAVRAAAHQLLSADDAPAGGPGGGGAPGGGPLPAPAAPGGHAG